MLSRIVSLLWILLLFPPLACWDAGVVRAVAADKAAGDENARIADRLVGKSVNIELQSGRTLQGVVIEKVTPGKTSGTVVKLQVMNSTTNKRSTLGAMAVRTVTAVGGGVFLVFDAASKSLVPPDPKRSEATGGAAGEDSDQPSASPSDSQPKSKSKTKSKAKPKSKPGSAKRDEERRKHNEEREAFFKKTGVRLWPDLTDEEQEALLEKQREIVQEVSKKFSALKMQLYETQYFLFLSDMPPAAAANYTACLDKMHEQLCRAFAIRDKDRVWLGGKLPVIAFLHGESFAEFEQEFFKMKLNPQMTQGLSHQGNGGNVLVSCHCGKDPYYFAAVIVHETTHGFIHRYKSGQIVPNWLNEGMADWTAMTVVRNDKGVQHKVKAAMERMKRNGNMGGNFFTAEHLAPEQYGMASAMVEYLLRKNSKGFREMIEGIKKGEKWQDALKKSYRVTPEELAYQFGLAIGIPNLRP